MYIKLQIDVPVLNQRLVGYSGKSRVKLPVYSFLSQVRLCFLLEQLEKQKKMTTPVPYLSVLAYQSKLQITVQRSRLLNVGFVCLFVFVLFSQFVLFFFLFTVTSPQCKMTPHFYQKVNSRWTLNINRLLKKQEAWFHRTRLSNLFLYELGIRLPAPPWWHLTWPRLVLPIHRREWLFLTE